MEPTGGLLCGDRDSHALIHTKPSLNPRKNSTLHIPQYVFFFYCQGWISKFWPLGRNYTEDSLTLSNWLFKKSSSLKISDSMASSDSILSHLWPILVLSLFLIQHIRRQSFFGCNLPFINTLSVGRSVSFHPLFSPVRTLLTAHRVQIQTHKYFRVYSVTLHSLACVLLTDYYVIV